MPILASQTVRIDVKEDKSITVILLEKFKKSKCVHIPSLSLNQDEMEKVRDTVKLLVGEKAIVCDKDTCCISNNYFDFVKKMRGLK